jgi:D-lactate dehydrogenase
MIVTISVLINQLNSVVGKRFVITSPYSMERFCKGYRSGGGKAIAVVCPGTLLEQWRVLELCVAANVIVIMQAANTGLTEGSAPSGVYGRDVIVLSTNRMSKIQIIQNGEQIIAFPGATLYALEEKLKPLNRKPHSVIGSSCVGASIIGGVCNNSGGALIERGPAYTELSLTAKVNQDGVLELINHLGINLGNDPETILTRLEAGDFKKNDFEYTESIASDKEYQNRVRDIDSETPARFNADPTRLYEASGCAGKLSVFAVRVDTYPKNEREKVFYIGVKNPNVLTNLRRDMLSTFSTLPVSAEYMHSECYDISKKFGKDTLILIDKLGTERLPKLFSIKGWLDARLNSSKWFPANFIDRIMQVVGTTWKNVLPKRMEEFRNRFDHHLILKMRDGGIDEARRYIKDKFDGVNSDCFECGIREAEIASLHRFVAAGAAVRYMAINKGAVADIIALDIALKRNERNWFEKLPASIERAISHKLYYGHFFCHVFHQDYVVKKGYDPVKVKEQLLAFIKGRGAKYPAEHNVGNMYKADQELANFYKKCDPTNSFNPGIGKMNKSKHYSAI